MSERTGEPLEAPLQRRIDALTAENAELRAILRAVPDLMFDVDEGGRYHRVWANDPGLLAAQQDLLVGRVVSEVLPPEAAITAMATIEEALRTGWSNGRTLTLTVPAGTRVFELSAAAVPHPKEGERHVVVLSRDITERVARVAERERAAVQLVEAGRRARTALEVSPNPSCVVDAGGDIVAVNPSWRAFAAANNGHPEVRSNYLATCDAVTGPDAADAVAMAAGLRAVLSGERPDHVQEYSCDGPSEKRWFQVRVVRIEGPGAPGALVEHMNITQHKLLERRLSQAQRTARIGHWELDLLADRLWWSDELYRIFELDQGKFNADYKAFLDLVHPDDRADVDRAYSNSVANGAPYHMVHRLCMADGRVKFIEERGETEYARSDGAPLRSWGTAQDITERVTAEAGLRSSEERLRLALQASGQGTWEIDLRAMWASYSPECSSMLGFTDKELPGENAEGFEQRLHPEDRERVLSAFGAYVSGATKKYAIEFRLRTKTGGWKWVLAMGQVVGRDSSGQPTRLIGLHTDIDQRKLSELMMATSLREKETLVREVHHRVKNNLQIVSSLLHFQSRKAAGTIAAELFDDVRERLRAMVLVHELLYRSGDLSRVAVGDYVGSLTRQIARSYSSATLRLQTDTGEEPILLPVETLLPTGMLVNELVSNAFKHAFRGGLPGTIQVGVARAGESFVLTIEDDGVGLPAAALSAPASTFGLQLVQSLVQQLGGTLKQGPGPGACIAILIPIPSRASSSEAG